MASEKVTALLEEIKAMTVLELSELVHAVEEEFGVSAAAAVAVAAPAEGGAAAAEEKTEFDLVLTEIGSEKIKVIKAVREITGLGLAEAKAVVDGAPKTEKKLCRRKMQKLPRQSSKKSARKSNSNKYTSKNVFSVETERHTAFRFLHFYMKSRHIRQNIDLLPHKCF